MLQNNSNGVVQDLVTKIRDYEYDKDLSYDKNLQNAYDYTWDHNVKHYDFVPWFYRPMNRQPLDPSRIISQIGIARNDIIGTFDNLFTVVLTSGNECIPNYSEVYTDKINNSQTQITLTNNFDDAQYSGIVHPTDTVKKTVPIITVDGITYTFSEGWFNLNVPSTVQGFPI